MARPKLSEEEKAARKLAKKEKKSVALLANPASVTYKMGVTVNTGNYENVRVEIAVTQPCDNAQESIANAYETTRFFVMEKLGSEVARVKQLAGV